MDSSGKATWWTLTMARSIKWRFSFRLSAPIRCWATRWAHELGHLLMGPGHRANGIMRAAWGRKELEALHQRRLKFQQAEWAAIMRTLAIQDTKRVRPAQANPE
jgi:hypothetical protein